MLNSQADTQQSGRHPTPRQAWSGLSAWSSKNNMAAFGGCAFTVVVMVVAAGPDRQAKPSQVIKSPDQTTRKQGTTGKSAKPKQAGVAQQRKP